VPHNIGLALILRTGVREFFVPKGLQDSAWGFNPRNTFKDDPP